MTVRGDDPGGEKPATDAAQPASRTPASVRAPAKFMRDFHRPRLWLALWAVMMGAVIAGSLLPARELPALPFAGFDKLEHFVGYAVLSAYAVMLFARMRARTLAAAGLVALGVGLEVAQAQLTVSRQAELADAFVNTLGVLAGLATAATPLARLLQRLDARWR